MLNSIFLVERFCCSWLFQTAWRSYFFLFWRVNSEINSGIVGFWWIETVGWLDAWIEVNPWVAWIQPVQDKHGKPMSWWHPHWNSFQPTSIFPMTVFFGRSKSPHVYWPRKFPGVRIQNPEISTCLLTKEVSGCKDTEPRDWWGTVWSFDPMNGFRITGVKTDDSHPFFWVKGARSCFTTS